MADTKSTWHYVAKTDAELEQLAQDIVAGKVFTSQDARAEDIPMVFMALVFMEKVERDAMKAAHVSLLYEYWDKAGPRSINGCPNFFSFHCLDRDDARKLVDRITAISAFMKARTDAVTDK